MRKFKNIAATARSAESLAAAPPRRRLLAGLAASLLALWLRPVRPAHADQPADQPAGGGALADSFTWLTRPKPVPATPFTLADGRKITLAAFRERIVLLNFWATWCAPCVQEMPSLDRLQAKLKDEGLAVIAVSEDFGGLHQVGPFFERLKLANLAIYLDSDGALAKAFGVGGLPTTLLIDREGRVVGGLEGAAAWDSEEAIALIRTFLQHPEKV